MRSVYRRLARTMYGEYVTHGNYKWAAAYGRLIPAEAVWIKCLGSLNTTSTYNKLGRRVELNIVVI